MASAALQSAAARRFRATDVPLSPVAAAAATGEPSPLSGFSGLSSLSTSSPGLIIAGTTSEDRPKLGGSKRRHVSFAPKAAAAAAGGGDYYDADDADDDNDANADQNNRRASCPLLTRVGAAPYGVYAFLKQLQQEAAVDDDDDDSDDEARARWVTLDTLLRVIHVNQKTLRKYLDALVEAGAIQSAYLADNNLQGWTSDLTLAPPDHGRRAKVLRRDDKEEMIELGVRLASGGNAFARHDIDRCRDNARLQWLCQRAVVLVEDRTLGRAARSRAASVLLAVHNLLQRCAEQERVPSDSDDDVADLLLSGSKQLVKR